MKDRLYTLGLVLVMSTLVLTGCALPAAQPTDTPVPTEAADVAPDFVLAARDAALAYIADHYGKADLASALSWVEENITPGWPDKPVPGWSEYQFTSDDWTVTVGHAVLPPERIIHRVIVVNEATRFQWEGHVDAAGGVSEAPEEVLIARDAALAYIADHYGEQAPPANLTWQEERTTPAGLLGAETYQYTAEGWVVTISYPIVRPDLVIYTVTATSEDAGFRWEGKVNAAGEVTEISESPPEGGQVVAGWLGFVMSTPEGAQYDDYLSLLPEGIGEIGLEGADEAIEAQIEELRDSGTPAHFWGTLTCDVPDYGNCQLLVRRVRPEGPGSIPPAEPVEGWVGTIASTPEHAQFDDFFVLGGDFPVQYGIDSLDSAISAQLENLRDSGITIRVWGEIACPALDMAGTQILVTRVEVQD